MSIRFKIGLGFAFLIVVLTSLTSYWAAQTLGFTLESSDLGKLIGLRAQVIDAYRSEQESLASLSREIALAIETLDFSDSGLEESIGVIEKLKRQMAIDWIEVYRDDVPLLYPSVRLEGPFLTSRRWPVRLAHTGPLSGSSFLVTTTFFASPSMSMSMSAHMVVARRPPPLSIPFYFAWDADGRLDGSISELPENDLSDLEIEGSTQQRLHGGRLFRMRADRMADDGPFLLVGYEADMAALSRTGVNALMVRLAFLEVIGLLILGYFLGRRLFEPLERLKIGIERVADGHWHQLPLNDPNFRSENDEIGILARSFNRMVRELTAAQDRLIQVQNQLLQKEKMAVLGRFSASVAHEINNPLGTILISAGLLKEAHSKARLNPYLGGASDGDSPGWKLGLANTSGAENTRDDDLEDILAIIEETKRCRKIIESLLRYAHNKPPELKPVSFGNMVAETIERFQGAAPTGKLKFACERFPDTLVMADPTGIHQVLRNLLENSRDAVAGVASPAIRLSACYLDENTLRVTVADNGPGLGEAAGHLFEPLMTTKTQGTGLGLAICQSIVEGHGGRIWVERSSDGWTLFHFTLVRVFPTVVS